MMIIKVTAPTSTENIFSYSPAFYSGFHLEYDGHYPWDSVIDYGSSPLNSIAYQSGVAATGGAYPDDGGQLTNKDLMSDLNGDGNPENTLSNTIYAQVSTPFLLPVSAELSFSKAVKSSADLQYGLETSTIGGGDYSYRLRLVSLENMNTDNIVIYDVLEDYDLENPNSWYGSLKPIDVKQPQTKGVDVVTYYSTVSGLKMSKPEDRNLTDTTIWSSVPPADLSSVTALAFDMRYDKNGDPYTLPPEQTLAIVMHMTAPTQNVKALEEAGACALNSAWFEGRTTSVISGDSNVNILETQNTIVHIRVPVLELDKQSDEPSGTSTEPALINEGDSLIYDVYVTNKEAVFPVKQIKFEDSIPSGLTIDFNSIKWYSSLDPSRVYLVNESAQVHASRSGQKLSFIVNKLMAGETIHFLIPTTVAPYTQEMIYENTAKITEAGGSKFEVESDTTYHKSIPLGGLTVRKTISGNAASSTQGFTFTVTLDDYSINGKYGDITFVNGAATFTLRAGESLTATGLLPGIGYTVEESDNSGYTVTVNNRSETIATGTILAYNTAGITFNNHKGSGRPDGPDSPDDSDSPDGPDSPVGPKAPDNPTNEDKPHILKDVPKTGDNSHTFWCLMISLFCMVVILVIGKRGSYKDRHIR